MAHCICFSTLQVFLEVFFEVGFHKVGIFQQFQLKPRSGIGCIWWNLVLQLSFRNWPAVSPRFRLNKV
ncbi:unnamed protein product [Amaranthus hypochondriacus]